MSIILLEMNTVSVSYSEIITGTDMVVSAKHSGQFIRSRCSCLPQLHDANKNMDIKKKKRSFILLMAIILIVYHRTPKGKRTP